MSANQAQQQAPAYLAKKGEAAPDLKSILNSENMKRQFALALPKHLSPDRFVRVATTALTRTPKLAQCTQASFFKCLLELSAFGLEPDGRRAHLIPYGNECTLVVDYKGLVELVRRSGEVAYIHADVVCEKDQFSFSYGSGAHLKHIPALKDRGAVLGAYSFVKLKDGSEDFLFVPTDEIEGIRKRSKAGKNGPWVTDWNAMAMKTAFRRHSKWLPFSSEIREAIEHDDEFIDISAQSIPEPKTPKPALTALPSPEPELEQEPEQEPAAQAEPEPQAQEEAESRGEAQPELEEDASWA